MHLIGPWITERGASNEWVNRDGERQSLSGAIGSESDINRVLIRFERNFVQDFSPFVSGAYGHELKRVHIFFPSANLKITLCYLVQLTNRNRINAQDFAEACATRESSLFPMTSLANTTSNPTTMNATTDV